MICGVVPARVRTCPLPPATPPLESLLIGRLSFLLQDVWASVLDRIAQQTRRSSVRSLPPEPASCVAHLLMRVFGEIGRLGARAAQKMM